MNPLLSPGVMIFYITLHPHSNLSRPVSLIYIISVKLLTCVALGRGHKCALQALCSGCVAVTDTMGNMLLTLLV